MRKEQYIAENAEKEAMRQEARDDIFQAETRGTRRGTPEATHLAHRFCGKLGVLNEGRRCGRVVRGEGEEGK